MNLIEYKVETVEIDFEKTKWYDTHKVLDDYSLKHSLEGLLNEYGSLGYTLTSITPLMNSVSAGGMVSSRTSTLIVTFQKVV